MGVLIQRTGDMLSVYDMPSPNGSLNTASALYISSLHLTALFYCTAIESTFIFFNVQQKIIVFKITKKKKI